MASRAQARVARGADAHGAHSFRMGQGGSCDRVGHICERDKEQKAIVIFNFNDSSPPMPAPVQAMTAKPPAFAITSPGPSSQAASTAPPSPQPHRRQPFEHRPTATGNALDPSTRPLWLHRADPASKTTCSKHHPSDEPPLPGRMMRRTCLRRRFGQRRAVDQVQHRIRNCRVPLQRPDLHLPH